MPGPKVPRKLKKTEFVIINQSLLGESGTHWCVLTRDISGSYEIFDSLGIDDSKEKLIKRYVPEKLCVLYNVNQFQDKTSSTCGLFCIYYLINKFFNTDSSMKDILSEIFSSDPKKNEITVARFFKK